MIYSDKFVWPHFPKCAGTKTERLFKKYFSDDEEIHQDIINKKVDPLVTWHDSIAQREERNPAFKLGSKTIIFPFRKLMPWLESKYNYEYGRNNALSMEFNQIFKGKFPESNGNFNHADVYIRKWLPDSILNSPNLKFIRTEYFKDDFINVFGEYIDISKIPEWEFEQYENTSVKIIPEEISKKLKQSIDLVYSNCPKWHAVEKIVYNENI